MSTSLLLFPSPSEAQIPSHLSLREQNSVVQLVPMRQLAPRERGRCSAAVGPGARGWTAHRLLLLSRGFVSPGSSVKKHPGSSHPLALPQIHAVRRGSVPRYQEGNGGQREEVEFFEEKGNVSLLTGNACVLEGARRMQQPNRREYARKASKT